MRLAEIGRELNVETVLEGSVRRSGSRVRITAQLVDVRDGFRRWSRELDRELTDVFAVQEEIARAVVEALNARLLPAAPPPPARPVNPEAYQHHLLGRHLYLNRFSSPGGFQQAAEAYERAIAIDPGFAPAWAGLGIPLNYSADALAPAEARAVRARALAAAERAVALDPRLPDALSTRGILRAMVRHDWAGGQADLERALSLAPGSADTNRRYAILLAERGRMPEALAHARRAVELDPMSMPSWTKLGQLLTQAGALAEARQALSRALEIVPDAQQPRQDLGDALLLDGRAAEAAAAYQRCGDEYRRLAGEALAQHALGHEAASRRALRLLETRHPDVGLEIARAYAWRGEARAALDWLERADAAGEPLGEGFKHDPFLRRLRGEPRYAALLRRLNLPAE